MRASRYPPNARQVAGIFACSKPSDGSFQNQQPAARQASATCNAIAAQQRQAVGFAIVVLGRLFEDADRMASSCAALERS
ncbi:hypothetical protein B8W70_19970 [Pseudomonas sp. 1239]|nr:hypothetical protein B8W70_19970 [Pseudomonas sp. 1239]